MTENTREHIDAVIASNGYYVAEQACLGCGGQDTEHCVYCQGTGHLKWAPWCHRPWDKIVDGLWVGGHSYLAPGTTEIDGIAIGVTPAELEDAAFDVVVSLYRDQCPPPAHARHHEFLFDDHPFALNRADGVRQVWHMARKAREAVEAGERVLVRCHAGMNRSALVAALALVQMGHEPQEAIDLIRARRSPFALFNTEFVALIRVQRIAKEQHRG